MTRSRTGVMPPWMLAVGGMSSVQLSTALAVSLIASVGSGGAAWLRLTAGALIVLLLARPPLRSIRRADLPVLLGLGYAFGTLMAVEPAIGTLLGLLILHQRPTLMQLLGVALVVGAGAAAQRSGDRALPVIPLVNEAIPPHDQEIPAPAALELDG